MTSNLWVMRHGEAAPGSPDAQRELTMQGRAEAMRMAGWLTKSLNVAQLTALRIAASPYRRAQQTAEIVAERLDKPIETLALLMPNDPLQPVIDWLQENAQHTPWLLVGHMPLAGALSAYLADGDPRGCLPMPTGAIAALEAEVWAAGCAGLVSFRYPAALTR